MIDVATYARVSTQDQDVYQQSRYIRDWCTKKGYNVVWSVLDQESGTIPLRKRKRFLRLINSNKVDTIVIYNLDRLSRNWEDQIFLEKLVSNQTKNIISTSDDINLNTASGRLSFRIMMAISCHMPEAMKERQKIGIARAKKQGKYQGRKKGSKNHKKTKLKKIA